MERGRLDFGSYPDCNFFMAPKFIQLLSETEELNEIFMFEEESGGYTFFFPPLINDILSNVPIYCDYEGYQHPTLDKQFFDLEFIYDSKQVQEMKGKRYHVFRHNVNKAKEIIGKEHYFDYRIASGKVIDELMLKWYQENPEREMFNEWIHYVDKYRLPFKVLFLDEEPVAINVWDKSPKYIHYILNYSIEKVRFLNEFSRWLFYDEMATRCPDYLVNDGGTMGIEGLERYKKKLNPISIRMRWSWI